MAIGKRSKHYKVCVRRRDVQPHVRQRARQRVPVSPDLSHLLHERFPVCQRCQRGRLADGRQVVGQAHDAHHIHDLLARRHVSEPQAGGAKRLRHRARDDEVGVFGEELERAGNAVPPEFAVGFIHDDDRVRLPSVHLRPGAGARLEQRSQVIRIKRGARRVIRGGEQHHGWAMLSETGRDGVDINPEIVSAGNGHEVGVDVARVLGVHRVGRREGHDNATRAGKGLENLEHDFVRAVRRPQARGR